MSNLAEQFEQQGTLLFDTAEFPLSDDEWRHLEKLINEVEYEHIVGGDAGEGHSVWVCRFYNDVDKPTALHARSQEVSDIIMSPKMMAFYKQVLGTDALCLRRCQANLLHQGDYIGVHIDQDSNPDYFATVVLHFNTGYQGGAFITRDQQRGDNHFHPAAHAALVNDCSIPHEVSKVESGERKTLACFLSKSFDDSASRRQNFRIVDK